MGLTIPPAQAVIDEQLNLAMENVDNSERKFPGMSYEEGVVAGIQFATGQSSELPMDD